MKHTIICCDLCNSRIFKDGWFYCEHGAIQISARTLEKFDGISETVYSHWKRRKYHICPKCVKKIKEVCNGGKNNAQDT